MNDRQWGIILGIAAIVVTTVMYILNGVDLAHRITIGLGVILCISLIMNFAKWRRSMKVKPSEDGLPKKVDAAIMEELNRRPVYYPEMGVALRELFDKHPVTVRAYSYIGNYIQEAICVGNYPDNLDLRILVRDPGSQQWTYPSAETGRQETQKNRIAEDVIDRLLGDGVASRLAPRRLQSPCSSWIRFYLHEPTYRCVVADLSDSSRTGYFGFYTLQEKPSTLDYSGRGRPVIRIDDSDQCGQDLLEDFVKWFDHYWMNIALREPTSI